MLTIRTLLTTLLIATLACSAFADPRQTYENTLFDPVTGQTLQVDYSLWQLESENLPTPDPEAANPRVIREHLEQSGEFSRATGYLSSAGYLRQATYANTGIWLDRETAEASLEY